MAKILFLEDEVNIREVLTEYMKMSHHQVVEVEDGLKAKEILSQDTFDLALLDINVPGCSGLEVLSFIRREIKSKMGVIMLTAYSDVNTQVEAFNEMADDYVVKPVVPILLLKRIEVLSQRIISKPSSQSGFWIDEAGYLAYYNQKNLHLTLSEFFLFQTLLTHPDQVFTREQLIEAIFHEEYFGSDRVIDAHVKNLRKKLPEDRIETVIGLGYRWRKDKQ